MVSPIEVPITVASIEPSCPIIATTVHSIAISILALGVMLTCGVATRKLAFAYESGLSRYRALMSEVQPLYHIGSELPTTVRINRAGSHSRKAARDMTPKCALV